jgi:putative transposase
LKGAWVPHDVRDEIVDFVKHWTERTELPAKRLLAGLKLSTSKFHQWKDRYGKANEHNAQVPRDWWLEDGEKHAILDFHDRHPLDGYRRLAFMMLDDDVVAASPSSVYRVLKQAGRLDRRSFSPSKKGTGFMQPLRPHEHWHIDVSYINLAGTFYFLCSVLDGYSRYIVHWELRETMKEPEIETILQRAQEKYPDEKPRIISDNGPQFIARDFKDFIRLTGMTHVRTSPYYPQSNGKLERWHGSLKRECIRPSCPANVQEARRRIAAFVDEYNHVRLHSTIGYLTPADKLNGLEKLVFDERDRKLEEARARRQQARRAAREACPAAPGALGSGSTWTEDRATQRCDPSADPGAETGVGAKHRFAPLPSSRLRDQHSSDKPSRQDAATLPQDALHQSLTPSRSNSSSR